MTELMSSDPRVRKAMNREAPLTARSGGKSFGQALRQARSAAALSQEQLAERAGLSARAISDLERGIHQTPHLETVRLLVDALRLDATDRADLLAAARPEAGTRMSISPE